MAARDVVTAAALQLMSMAEKGTEEGVLMATVTVPVNSTDGEASGSSLFRGGVVLLVMCLPCWLSSVTGHEFPLERLLTDCHIDNGGVRLSRRSRLPSRQPLWKVPCCACVNSRPCLPVVCLEGNTTVVPENAHV